MITLPSEFQQYIYKSRYARYNPESGRREEWPETVDRYLSFFKEDLKRRDMKPGVIPWNDLRDAILGLHVMPSMRCLMTAGEALERDNVAGYNCAYLPIDSMRAFDEILYILMCGTGVGFSVERQYIAKLPELPHEYHKSSTVVVFADSKIGWARGYKEYISLLLSGNLPRWDTSRIRPKGSPLKTFGGRASGPEPLEDLLRFTEYTFVNAAGRRLTSLECHDLVCKIADVVVCGGVRRSALLSLSNLTDERMRNAKHGEWWKEHPERALANNSVCYTEKPDTGIFLREWESLYSSRSGERGIFSRTAAQAQAGRNGRRDAGFDFGTNPCSEIILRPRQFCNLSEAVVRAPDKIKDMREKVELAAIIGTLQSTLTTFRYIGKQWMEATVDERLLGVSLTGIYDNAILGDPDPSLRLVLGDLRDAAIRVNKEYAHKLGIEQSRAITCVKPSGTVSQLCNSSSGIHPRFSEYYIRRVRMSDSDPLTKYMEGNGFKCETDFYNDSARVFSFPIASPTGCVTRKDVSALDQLKLWKMYQDRWCEHKPSVTIQVREDEWMDVGAWVYTNFNEVSGVSFLPYDSGTYRQPPYEEITKDEYNKLIKETPKDVCWTAFKEDLDSTTGSQELACVSGSCEL